ncbi:hypothetical protein TNCV_3708641 [Trichonephila clavipes]|nr:hypothetical protein TNCV_3708641 [Trichonephila clavipes]
MLWGRQVAGRNYPPINKNTLIRALTEEWDKLPQQLLDNVVQNFMPSTKEPENKGAECTFCNEKFFGDQREKIWIPALAVFCELTLIVLE